VKFSSVAVYSQVETRLSTIPTFPLPIFDVLLKRRKKKRFIKKRKENQPDKPKNSHLILINNNI